MYKSKSREQNQRQYASLVRAYQTYYIFRNRRFEELSLKVITFLGIAFPLISGGIIQTLYTGEKPPAWVLIGSGLGGLTLTVLSLWAVIDGWDEKVHCRKNIVEKFSTLVTEMESLSVRTDGQYDEDELSRLERQSREGRNPDDKFFIPEEERGDSLKIAEKKYPPP